MVDVTINKNTVKVYKDITNIEDFEKIKSFIEKIRENEKILILEIIDSVFITSSLIGYLYKLREKDGLDIIIRIGKKELKEVFEDLNLLNVFKVEMI